jgi:hypothetical protein
MIRIGSMADPIAPDTIRMRSRARVWTDRDEKVLVLVPNLERVRIGSDGACDLVLPGLPACAVVVFEHGGRLVLRERPSQPREVPHTLAPGDRDIDDEPFVVGPYRIHLECPRSSYTEEVNLDLRGSDRQWMFAWELFERGIVLGSDRDCHVVLPALAPVAAVIYPVSNHRMLRMLPAETRLPIPRCGDGLPAGPGSRRVDYGDFEIGRYTFAFVR